MLPGEYRLLRLTDPRLLEQLQSQPPGVATPGPPGPTTNLGQPVCTLAPAKKPAEMAGNYDCISHLYAVCLEFGLRGDFQRMFQLGWFGLGAADRCRR